MFAILKFVALFALSVSVWASPDEKLCENLKTKDAPKIARQLNQLLEKKLEGITRMRGEPSSIEVVEKALLNEIENALIILNCLDASQTDPQIQKLIEQIKDTRDVLKEDFEADNHSNLDHVLGPVLDSKFFLNDREGIYSLKKRSQLRYLDTGSELRDETFETIRTADKFLHLSYFEFFDDRMGHMMAAAIIANKMGFRTPAELRDVAAALGVPGPLNSDASDTAYITGPIPSEKFEKPGRKTLEAAAEKLKQDFLATGNKLKPISIRIYIDDFKKLKAKLNKAGIIGALETFGVEIKKENGFLTYSTNHTKISANESRAVVSGGNVVDKVMDWTLQRRWRDAAILVEGELATDVNHFFLAQFMNKKHYELDEHLLSNICHGDTSCLSNYKDPVVKPSFGTQGRIIWSSNRDIKKSPTMKAFRTIVGKAQKSLMFENSFFSDGLSAFILWRKARNWDLRKTKKLNGEKPTDSTCGPDYFSKVAQRKDPLGAGNDGRYILVILPERMDQPIVKLTEATVASHLTFMGVDVCKWSGDLNNKFFGTNFEDKTMLHSKVYMADENLVYIGSANLNKRSMRSIVHLGGDLEIGILTNDPSVIADVKSKMFINDVTASRSVKYSIWGILLMPIQVIINILGFT